MTSSGSASQPAAPPGVARGGDAEPVRVQLRVGTFNVGIHQEMLDKKRHQNKFRQIILKGFMDGNCSLMGFCEVGGHMQGLEDANIRPSTIIANVLHEGCCNAVSHQAYMYVWDQVGSADTRGIAVRLRTGPYGIPIRPDLAVEPQLVICEFDVTAKQHPGNVGRLVHGVLHIRSNKKHHPSPQTKQNVTALAMKELEKRANSSDVQHPVCILTGDTNMGSCDADAVVQPVHGAPDVIRDWHIETSTAGLSGDIAFIKGAASEQFDISVGKSYEDDRGMRIDSHDFFGFSLAMPLAQEPSSSGASKPAAEKRPLQEPTEDKDKETTSGAEQETAAKRTRTIEVGDDVVQELREWYERRCGGTEGREAAWEHLQRCLFKRVRMRVEADMWWTSELGEKRHDDDNEGQIMVVSKEYVANQVRSVIQCREKWLAENNLPLDTKMTSDQKNSFLEHTKKEFHNREDQKQQQARDAKLTGKKQRDKRWSRWNRHMQIKAGTIPMWQVLSFTGRFDPEFFNNLKPPPLQEGELSPDQKERTKRAVFARGQFRMAQTYDKLREKHGYLSRSMKALLARYDNDSLRKEANEATLHSGNGRLRREDGTKMDIGGSTGGLTRILLEHWKPRDGRAFLNADPAQDRAEDLGED